MNSARKELLKRRLDLQTQIIELELKYDEALRAFERVLGKYAEATRDEDLLSHPPLVGDSV